MKHPSRLALTILVATVPMPAQGGQDQIALLEGPAHNNLALRVLDESKLNQAGKVILSQLQILPIEITNRTPQLELQTDRARRLQRNGLWRVELPGGGRLFEYRRAVTSGARFGYLLILSRGQVVPLLELAGVGAGGNDSPFEDRIGVAADGRHAVVVTKPGALYVLRLDGKRYASSKSPARQVSLKAPAEHLSLCPGKSHVFFQTQDDRVWRCPLADNGVPQDMTPSAAAGSRFKEEMAPAADGDSVVFLFGPKKLWSIYHLKSSGPLVKLPPKPAKYEDPGYLPQNASGARLALNHDGSRLLYVDSTLRDEIFLLDTTGKTKTFHVTSDSQFQPYIGIGILPAFAAGALTIAVGDSNAHDWYTVGTKFTNVVNLTRTTKETKPPYGSGALSPQASHMTGSRNMVTALKQKNGSQMVQRIDTTGNSKPTTITTALRRPMQAGDGLAGLPTLLVPGMNGDSFLNPSTALPVLIGPAGVFLSPEILGQGGQFSVFVASDATGITMPVVRIVNGPLLLLPAMKGLQQVVLTAAGGGILNGPTLRYLAPGRNIVIPSTASVRVVISGAGG